jgi:hypothetical protein
LCPLCVPSATFARRLVRMKLKSRSTIKGLIGAPERIRTSDPQIRRLIQCFEIKGDFCKPSVLQVTANQRLIPDLQTNYQLSLLCSRAMARPARMLARTPHGYHDTTLIRSELEDAGFSPMVSETKAEQSRASLPRISAVAYCQGTRNRGQRTGKTGIGNRLRRIRYCRQTWHRRGCCQIQAHVIMAMV